MSGLRRLLKSSGYHEIASYSSAWMPKCIADLVKTAAARKNPAQIISGGCYGLLQNILRFGAAQSRRLETRRVFPNIMRRFERKFQFFHDSIRPRRDFRIPFQQSELRRVLDRMMSEETDLMASIRMADLVVVNGEGTLHHDQKRVLSIMTVLRAAQLTGKETWVVNASFQALHRYFLHEVLKRCSFVSARESVSHAYLLSVGVHCIQAADCAFVADWENGADPPKLPAGVDPERACMVTSGAWAHVDRKKLIVRAIKLARKRGYDPFYVSLSNADLKIMEGVCTKLRVPNVPYPADAWQMAMGFLRRSKIVITGRYHLAVFCLIAGVPFIPLSTITWKMDGVCDFFEWPIRPVFSPMQLNAAFALLKNGQPAMRRAFELAAQKGRTYAQKNVPTYLAGGMERTRSKDWNSQL